MHESSQQEAQELCCQLESVLARIQADDQADEDVKLAAFDIQEDLRFFHEAVFWSELRRGERTVESLLVTADRNEQNAPSSSPTSSEKAPEIKPNGPSTQYSDMSGDACYGGLVGIGVASLHHVHHALTSQIPANIPTHVLGELAAAACGGAILSLFISAICRRHKTRRNFA